MANFDDLFESTPVQPEVELKPDYADDGRPLLDDARGAKAARDRFAEEVGADAAEISVALDDYALYLMKGGVVVDLDIHRWTGKIRLTPHDLGLGERVSSRVLTLGDKLLMPPTILRMFDSLTNRMRQNLKRCSYRTLWGYWVPSSAYQKWKSQHDDLVKEYYEVAEALASNLEQVKTSDTGTWGELRRTYAEHARAAWCRTQRLPISEDNLDACPGIFVEQYITAILKHIPPADEIRRSFAVETHIYYIPLPSMLEEDRLRQQRLWEKAADERAADRERMEAEAAMHAEVRQHYAAKKGEMIDDFLGGLAGQMYNLLYDVSTNALATIKRNQGKLLEPTIRQLNRLVEWGETMNVMDDQEIAKMTSDLKAMVERSKEARSVDDIETQLSAMGTVARSVLLDLNIAPQVENDKVDVAARDALLGIGPRLSRASVAEARQHLETDDIPELPIVQARRGARPATSIDVPKL